MSSLDARIISFIISISSHSKHSPESSLPTHHMIISIIRFSQRELLNHTLDIVQFREIDGFLTV